MAFDSIDKMFRDMLKRYNSIFGPDIFDSFNEFVEPEEVSKSVPEKDDENGFEDGDTHRDKNQGDPMNKAEFKSRKFGYEIISGSDMKEPIIRIYGNPDEFPELKDQLERFIKNQLGSLPVQQDLPVLRGNNLEEQPVSIGPKADQEPYTETFKDADGDTIVNIDLPGINETDLSVKSKGKSLIVEASNGSRNFKKTIPLDGKIEEKDIQWKLNNGILEIKVPKKLS
ncbi:MAG TPA: Hsp20/alpha crystallin family protein [Candidatus Lokiarchaeia archaeon]|nr:Hsp20/alpha crystallin family protein [Candidatus Lokiarchaeia archaeon]